MEGGVQVLMEHINSEFLLLAFKIFLSAVAVLWLKQIAETVVGSITFRLNPYVAVGRNVRVDGFLGRIVRVTWSSIVVYNEERSETRVVPTARWKWMEWIFGADSS